MRLLCNTSRVEEFFRLDREVMGLGSDQELGEEDLDFRRT